MNEEFDITDSRLLKGFAILFMLGLHLYNTLDYNELYKPVFYFGEYPLIYYISFFFDSCLPIYCFVSGYALYLKNSISLKDNGKRILKFLKRYWLILVLTSFIGILLKNEEIPGNIFKFLGNFFLINVSYVGAWWFVQTYILLLISTPWIIKATKRFEKSFCILVVVIYFISYYFRIINPVQVNSFFISTVIKAMLLFGTSLFPFVIGMLFYKHLVISRIRQILSKNNIIVLLIVVICIILHILMKSMIIAPFIAIIFIIGFAIMNFNIFFKRILLYLGVHSTSIWLVHMQFYMIFFPSFVFYTQTAFGCLLILLGLSLLSSYVINFIERLLYEKIIKKFIKPKMIRA